MYFINGNDQYLIDLKVKKIIKDTDSDVLNLDMETCSFSDAEQYLSTPPFIENKKTLVLSNVIFFARGSNKNKNFTDKQLESLMNAGFENEFILTCSKNKADEKSKNFTKYKDKLKTIIIEDLNDASFKTFAKTLVAKRNIEIDATAFNYLIKASNLKSDLLVNNIKKLELVKKPIDLATIKLLVNEEIEYVGFDLSNAIFKGDLEKALEIKEKLINLGESEIAIIALISSTIRTIHKIKIGEVNGLSPKEVIDITKLNPYFVKKNVDVAFNLDMEEIEALINSLYKLDNDFKSSSDDLSSMFDLMIVNLCNKMR